MPIHRTGNGFVYRGPMVVHTKSPDALVVLADDDSFDDIVREMLAKELQAGDVRQVHLEDVRITFERIED